MPNVSLEHQEEMSGSMPTREIVPQVWISTRRQSPRENDGDSIEQAASSLNRLDSANGIGNKNANKQISFGMCGDQETLCCEERLSPSRIPDG